MQSKVISICFSIYVISYIQAADMDVSGQTVALVQASSEKEVRV